ncbi:uncharacterized protein BJX67DRAFT_380504 [Aspergillus lucknowensis]|uniref:RING-type domain-containing protein n=1 Tax=Aspergillus lucknowensis TaxID=176173 RepID=A0ABR4LU94_9EURO
MSLPQSTPPTAAPGRSHGGTKASTPQDTSGLFQTLQGHVDDIRALIQCGICIRPLYEPFTLACGHTFCYGCLTSWFAEGRSNKTCPDCRAPVKSQPAPAYLVRAVVQLFTSRPELLDKGETTDQHKTHQLEEAGKLEADKKNTNPREAGLFRGIFNKSRHQPAQPIIDLEDGVVRCPHCSWELDEMGCVNCGFRHDDDSMSDWGGDSEENSEMTDDPYDDGDDDIEDGFGEAPGFDWGEWYDGLPLEALPPELRYGPVPGVGRSGFPILPGAAALHDHSDLDSHGSTLEGDDDEEYDEEEDEDMDSFIDDGEPSEDYSSDSGRSTIVGHPDYSREELHAIFDDSASSGYSTAHSNVFDFSAAPDSGDEENENTEGDELEVDYGGEFDDEEEGNDDDDDEGPIRPTVTGTRRRISTYQILSSSSPFRPSGEAPRTTGFNGGTRQATQRREQPPSAGSSATRAIAVDDDSDEGPIAPTRRARDRGNCRPSVR